MSLLVTIAAAVAGAALFFSGFFLTRMELRSHSSCDDLLEPGVPSFLNPCNAMAPRAEADIHPTPGTSSTAPERSCWQCGRPRYDRLAFIVIDAWRHDFARWSGNGSDNAAPLATPYYLNRMPRLARLLHREPHTARLYKAVADAPTVTQQRLKGITTGSLPTFVDVGSSFSSSVITEDNIIAQIIVHRGRGGLLSRAKRRAGKGDAAAARGGDESVALTADASRSSSGVHNHSTFSDGDDRTLDAPAFRSVFAGDDTWASLFPLAFNTVYAFPSFNVADLHGVDNGVKAHLSDLLRIPSSRQPSDHLRVPTEIKSVEPPNSHTWGLLVAHFLGVDHVGHRLGPSHPTMAAKLDEMDVLLVDTLIPGIRAQDAASGQSTLLLVMGDHGMTPGGNHGGATDDETSAALLVVGSDGGDAAAAALLEGNGDFGIDGGRLDAAVAAAAAAAPSTDSPDASTRHSLPAVTRPFASTTVDPWHVFTPSSTTVDPWHVFTPSSTEDDANGCSGHCINHMLGTDNAHCSGEQQSNEPSGSSISRSGSIPPYPIRTVSQVDIVPTIAMLLGVPIPFASLGAAMPDLAYMRVQRQSQERHHSASCTSSGSSTSTAPLRQYVALLRELVLSVSTAHALAANVWQVSRYIETYNGASASFSASVVASLMERRDESMTAYAASLRVLQQELLRTPPLPRSDRNRAFHGAASVSSLSSAGGRVSRIAAVGRAATTHALRDNEGVYIDASDVHPAVLHAPAVSSDTADTQTCDTADTPTIDSSRVLISPSPLPLPQVQHQHAPHPHLRKGHVNGDAAATDAPSSSLYAQVVIALEERLAEAELHSVDYICSRSTSQSNNASRTQPSLSVFPSHDRKYERTTEAATAKSSAATTAGATAAAASAAANTASALRNISASLRRTSTNFHALLSDSASQCRALWTQFDMRSMVWGLVLLLIAFVRVIAEALNNSTLSATKAVPVPSVQLHTSAANSLRGVAAPANRNANNDVPAGNISKAATLRHRATAAYTLSSMSRGTTHSHYHGPLRGALFGLLVSSLLQPRDTAVFVLKTAHLGAVGLSFAGSALSSSRSIELLCTAAAVVDCSSLLYRINSALAMPLVQLTSALERAESWPESTSALHIAAWSAQSLLSPALPASASTLLLDSALSLHAGVLRIRDACMEGIVGMPFCDGGISSSDALASASSITQRSLAVCVPGRALDIPVLAVVMLFAVMFCYNFGADSSSSGSGADASNATSVKHSPIYRPHGSSSSLQPPLQQLQLSIENAGVVHADETYSQSNAVHGQNIRYGSTGVVALLLIVLRLWALFTNSFIVAEPRVVAFLLQSATVLLAWVALQLPHAVTDVHVLSPSSSSSSASSCASSNASPSASTTASPSSSMSAFVNNVVPDAGAVGAFSSHATPLLLQQPSSLKRDECMPRRRRVGSTKHISATQPSSGSSSSRCRWGSDTSAVQPVRLPSIDWRVSPPFISQSQSCDSDTPINEILLGVRTSVSAVFAPRLRYGAVAVRILIAAGVALLCTRASEGGGRVYTSSGMGGSGAGSDGSAAVDMQSMPLPPSAPSPTFNPAATAAAAPLTQHDVDAGWLQSMTRARRSAGSSSAFGDAAAHPPSLSSCKWLTSFPSTSIAWLSTCVRLSASRFTATSLSYVAAAVTPLPVEASARGDVTWLHTLLPSLVFIPALIALLPAFLRCVSDPRSLLSGNEGAEQQHHCVNADGLDHDRKLHPSSLRSLIDVWSRRAVAGPSRTQLLLWAWSVSLHALCCAYWLLQERQFTVDGYDFHWARLVLPRVVFAAAAVTCAALMLHQRCCSRARGRGVLRGAVSAGGVSTAPQHRHSAVLLLHSLPSISLLLGPSSPVILLCMCVHACALLFLIHAVVDARRTRQGSVVHTAVLTSVAAARTIVTSRVANDDCDFSLANDDSDSSRIARHSRLRGLDGDAASAAALLRNVNPTTHTSAASHHSAPLHSIPPPPPRVLADFSTLLSMLLCSPAPLLSLLWYALVSHYYAASGHGNAFSSLAFSAAFVGWDDYAPLRSGAMLALNTFAAHAVLLGCFGPGLLRTLAPMDSDAPLAVDAVNDSSSGSGDVITDLTSGDGNAHSSSASSTRGGRTYSVLTPLYAAQQRVGVVALLLVMPVGSLFATALFCAIERRHLMVWAIFAPKLIFDAASALVSALCVLPLALS